MTLTEGINVLSDLLGGGGAIFLALAFLRRERLRKFKKERLDPESYPVDSPARRLVTEAANVMDDLIDELAPANFAWGVAGAVLLFFSFITKLTALFLTLYLV
jgi:hypothetical protein